MNRCMFAPFGRLTSCAIATHTENEPHLQSSCCVKVVESAISVYAVGSRRRLSTTAVRRGHAVSLHMPWQLVSRRYIRDASWVVKQGKHRDAKR
jgi:hypothetical protein